MSLEKNSWLMPVAVLIGFIVLAVVLFFTMNNMAFKVATIDTDKIIKESELGQKINKELQSKIVELRQKLQLAKTDAEKQQIEVDLSNFRTEKQREFTDEVKVIIKKVAKAKGVKAVSNPQVFLYSDIDLTDDVIKELDK